MKLKSIAKKIVTLGAMSLLLSFTASAVVKMPYNAFTHGTCTVKGFDSKWVRVSCNGAPELTQVKRWQFERRYGEPVAGKTVSPKNRKVASSKKNK